MNRDLHRLGALLARWHFWRKHYTTERSYARQGGPTDPEDQLEQLLMESIEQAVTELPNDLQRAIGHVAQAECLGVACDYVRLYEKSDHASALGRVRRGLIAAGVL